MHGVNSILDAKLLDELVKRNIHLEICPGSNLSLSVFADWDSHPLHCFISKGISVSLNSDDPPFFHTSIGLEYINSAKHMNISLEKLKNISLMAMDASFADADTKSRLMNKIIEF